MLEGKRVSIPLEFMALVRKSEYLMSLSGNARARYESKVSSLGLTTDPYCIEEWTEAPEDVPSVQWSVFTWSLLQALTRARRSK